MIALSPKASWRYVLVADRDRPKSEQTVFELKHLSLEDDQARINNYETVVAADGSRRVVPRDIGEWHLGLLRRYVTGWTNLRREDGSQVEFARSAKTGLVRDDLLALIPLLDRVELANALENELAFDPDRTGESAPAAG